MNHKKELFNIGDRIELVRLDDKDTKSYPSQILDITNRGTFIVGGPIYKNKIILVHKDEIIKVTYIINHKGRYAFNAKVLRRDCKRIYQLEVERVSEITRYQQRRHYRFDITIPVDKSLKKDDDILTENCRTKDISGSGMKLYSNFKHDIGDIVRCIFNIDNYKIDVEGRILRIEDIDTFEYNYSLAIEFIDLKENDKEKIIKFIFLKQRLLREKGLI